MASLPPSEPAITFSDVGPPAPLVDGSLDDWHHQQPLLRDALGDAEGRFDVTEVLATSRGSHLYLAFDTTHALNLYAGPASDGTLVVDITFGDSSMSVDLRRRSALVDGFKPLSWYGLDVVTAPTHAADRFELRIDLDPLGVGIGDTVHIGMSGSDQVAPAAFELRMGAPAVTARSMDRQREGDLRIASLNTLQAGLVAQTRGAAMTRLLRAASADIVCLQELGQTPPGLLAQRLHATDGASWNVHAVSQGSIVGNAVASHHPLIPIEASLQRVAAAVVLRDEPVAVFSVHLKCCGYAGSAEDQQRIAQVAALRDTIDALRSASLGPELAPYADVPVVAVGDFNDVGSAELQQKMVADGLQRWQLTHLPGDEVYTWSCPDASFPPGMLDLLFYSPGLSPHHGYVLNSDNLSDAALQESGLRRHDSFASDHLMLVADFAGSP